MIESSRIKIHDVSNNSIVIMPLGKARIRIGYIRTVHPINLEELNNLILNITNTEKNNINNIMLSKLLKMKATKLKETIAKIRRTTKRHKRWDTVGQIWKWIAGSPDADDLRIINSTMNEIINQNNKQVMINDGMNSRLEEVIHVVNNAMKTQEKSYKVHQAEVNQLIKMSHINTLQDQIETIEEAMLTAKHGIPSSKLLSMEDLSNIDAFLATNDMHYATAEEILLHASAQMAMNKTHVIYILKFPRYAIQTYEYEFIDSVINSGKRILLKENYVLRNETHVLETKQPCERRENFYSCETTYLQQPTRCVTDFVQGNDSECPFERVYTNGIIKRIGDDRIFINDATAKISSNCNPLSQFINGSYIVQFQDCNVLINGELFSNTDVTINPTSYRSTIGLSIKESFVRDIPTIEYVSNLTLAHRDALENIKLETHSFQWKLNLFGSTSGITLVIITAIAAFFCIFRNRQPSVKVEIPSAPQATNNFPSPSAVFISTPATFQTIQKTLRTK